MHGDKQISRQTTRNIKLADRQQEIKKFEYIQQENKLISSKQNDWDTCKKTFCFMAPFPCLNIIN